MTLLDALKMERKAFVENAASPGKNFVNPQEQFAERSAPFLPHF